MPSARRRSASRAAVIGRPGSNPGNSHLRFPGGEPIPVQGLPSAISLSNRSPSGRGTGRSCLPSWMVTPSRPLVTWLVVSAAIRVMFWPNSRSRPWRPGRTTSTPPPHSSRDDRSQRWLPVIAVPVCDRAAGTSRRSQCPAACGPGQELADVARTGAGGQPVVDIGLAAAGQRGAARAEPAKEPGGRFDRVLGSCGICPGPGCWPRRRVGAAGASRARWRRPARGGGASDYRLRSAAR